MSFAEKIKLLGSVTRANDWRLSFIPFIIGCVYLWLYYFEIEFSFEALLLFAFSLLTSFGFAALGYFINEFFDKTDDLKAGKFNKLAYLKPPYQFLLFLTASALTFLPWLYLPKDNTTYTFIAIEITLFLLYSLPYIRLKNIPVVSNIIDAAYAYVIPLVLAFYTYSLFAASVFSDFIFLFASAVFIIGFRNIFIHQVNDVFKDKRSGIYTLPMLLGVLQSNLFIKLLLLLEFVLVLLFVWSIAEYLPEMLLGGLAYIGFTIFRLYKFRNSYSSIYFSIQSQRHLFDAVYQIAFPLFSLLLLIFSDFKWTVLLPFHILLLVPFTFLKTISIYLSKVKSIILNLLLRFKNYVHFILSSMVNYPIYLLFKLFGVDLKKENKSALGYIKSRWK